jgi:ElaB/YqjD/DUF883 family membrane-anchored ribosome-binding protein
MVSEQSQTRGDRLMQTAPGGGPGGDLGTTAKETAQNLQDTAQDVMQQTKETAGQVVGQAKEQAANQLDDRKEQVAESFGSVAEALRAAGNHLRENEQAPIARYADKAAARVDQFAYQLRGKDMQEIVRDMEDYARRQPALFLGGAFVVGLLAARFLKSTAHRDDGQANSHDRGYGSGEYRPGSYSLYRGGVYQGSRGFGSAHRGGRAGYYGGSYETSGRAEYYGGEPATRGRGFAAGTTDYGADRMHDGVEAGPYPGGMGESTGTTSGNPYGMTDERGGYARDRGPQ